MRNVGGAVLGSVVMAGAVFLLFAVQWMVFGSDGAFQPQSWEVSGMWLLGSIVVSLLAAALGGLVCAWVAADDRGLLMLMALVVVMGVAIALGDVPATEGARLQEVGMTEAMNSAQQPKWMAWLNPVLGVAGAFAGSRLVRNR
ncbi:MAG: hypothetical protein F4123_13315 [Gemmatimonadetes bacterium]|nr:hypothetical protein [Gemmatimonadota bacterium]MYI47333.1 hypothetical protein [Gemmatimonadota bacterium]MYK65533.1 hypothetical protein [Gemmatimonadota bacterium]